MSQAFPPRRARVYGAFLPLFALLLALLLPAPAALAMTKKKLTTTVRIHAEGNAMDGPSFSTGIKIPYPPYDITIKQIPEISEWDVKAFKSYPKEDGTYAALLMLSPHGKNMLETVSLEKPRSYLVIKVNGRMLDAVFIDRPVRDGKFYIKGGLTARDIELFAQNFDMIDAADKERLKAIKAEARAREKEDRKAGKKREKDVESQEEGIILIDDNAPSDSRPVERAE